MLKQNTMLLLKKYLKLSVLLPILSLLALKDLQAQVPTITSFLPISAKPGTAVTLTGTNFNTTPANNIVFFGATKATVTAATATTVTVTVPTGATYAPITLLNTLTSLAAYSLSNFTPTYSPAKADIALTDFETKQDFTTGTIANPRSLAMGDLDGDGKPDLAVVNYASNSVSVYLNTSTNGSIGSGSFSAKVDFATGSGPYSLAIGDLDGDGKPDLVVANYNSNSVSIIRNTSDLGSITFSPKEDFASGTFPGSVAIGDLDGDGKLDLAVTNLGFSVQTVSVIRNTSSVGSVSFEANVPFPVGTVPISVAIGDLDGDGRPDLAVANEFSYTVSVIRNTSSSGSISFTEKVDFSTGFLSGPRSVAIGDLDGDGRPDLAVGNYCSSEVAVLRNISSSGSIGLGSFATNVVVATGVKATSVAIGDLDGDGKPDLAVANYTPIVSVIRNTSTSGTIGSNSFAAKVDYTTGESPNSVAIGDLDGDGRPDLAVANFGSSTVSVLRNAGDPPTPTIISFSPVSAKPGTTVILRGTNFNPTPANNIVFFGATKATVTASTDTTATVTVPASATYAPITLLNTGTSLAAYSMLNFTPTYSPAKTELTLKDFQIKQDFTSGNSPRSVAMGDLDGDGKPELVVANDGSSTVSVYRNTSTMGSVGSGSFAAKVDFITGGSPRSVAIGDLNGDGKPDLAVVKFGSDSVSVIRNTTTGGTINFAPKVDFATGSGPQTVAIGDLNGDGKPDLAVVNGNDYTVSVILNTSLIESIRFAAKVDFTTGDSPVAVAIGDLNGDGMPDLAVTNAGSNSVSVIRNTSTGGSIGFATKEDFGTGVYPFSLAMGDLDGDGVPDLATANLFSNTVSIIHNRSTSGSIVLDPQADFNTGSKPIALVMGDLDGDGKPDLAVANANFAGSTFSIRSWLDTKSAVANANLGEDGAFSVSIIRNTSTSNSINFAPKVDFPTGLLPLSVAVGDLDGDDIPDLAVANAASSTVSVLRNANANADLSSLTLSAGTLSPTFSAATITYTVSVANAITSLTLTPTLAEGTASVKVNSTTVVSGNSSGNITLTEGSNTINVEVTAQSGTTKTYIITVTRSILPTFSAVAAICSGATLLDLPTTSNNSIVGTWSPALDNLNTTTYIFTPTSGQNAISTTLTISVNPNPSANASSNSPICAGTSLNLTGGGVGNYAWSGPNDYSSTAESPTISNATVAASGVYTLMVTNANSCTSTANTSVTVNAAVAIPTSQANTSVVLGGSITLTAAGCSGVTDLLKWYQASDNSLVTMPVSPTDTTNYYANCESTLNGITCVSANSNVVTVMVISRVYVDIAKMEAPIQDGNSWATAFGSLQAGLAAATPGQTVWVAKGTYKPTTTRTRTIYFNVPNSIAVYGGFAGTENNMSQRDLNTNVSILSGDIGTENVTSDNSFHVVVMDGSSSITVLDGFTITGGNANFDPKLNASPAISAPASEGATIETGGGILVLNAGMPIIAHCKIINNQANFGGGIFCIDGSSFTLNESTISNNEATFGSAIYAQNASHYTLNNGLIVANRGLGCVYNSRSNPILSNCTIASNGGYNGALFNSQSQPTVTNSILWGNAEPVLNDSQTQITYSLVQGGYSGIGNLNEDPKFVNPAPYQPAPNTTGDYHLQVSSLAIDRGDNGAISLLDKDLDGNLRRFSGGKVDMGAYEFQGAPTAKLIISVVTGPWEANSTWDLGRVPKLGDYVIIENNHIVTLSTTGIAKNLEYRGTGQLKFNTITSKVELGF